MEQLQNDNPITSVVHSAEAHAHVCACIKTVLTTAIARQVEQLQGCGDPATIRIDNPKHTLTYVPAAIQYSTHFLRQCSTNTVPQVEQLQGGDLATVRIPEYPLTAKTHMHS